MSSMLHIPTPGQPPLRQVKKAFFDPTVDRRYPHLPPAPTDDEVRLALSANNAACALNRIIVGPENEGNMRILRRFAFTAFRRSDHSLRGCNFGIFATAGQGKTFIVKTFAETVGIVFVFVQSDALESTWMLFEEIAAAFDKIGIKIVPDKTKDWDFRIPPCLVFFDEAHRLKKSMMKGGLLNAMEPDDGIMMATRPGSSSEAVRFNMRDVAWVAGTTERGLLFDAFDTRLGTPIEWHPAGPNELPLIIKQAMDRRLASREFSQEMPIEACKFVARFCKIPRLAINFAVKVMQQKAMMPSDTWEESVQAVAHDIGLDQWGWSKKQVKILAALGQRPIAEHRLSTVCQCRIEQIQQYELPLLTSYIDGGPFVVPVRGRGLCITEAGLKELEKRSICHNGTKVTAEHFESKR